MQSKSIVDIIMQQKGIFWVPAQESYRDKCVLMNLGSKPVDLENGENWSTLLTNVDDYDTITH